VALKVMGAELVVRRFELHPLGTYREAWTAIQASGGTYVSVREGQGRPMSVEESKAQIHLDGPYEAQIVAAEPLVHDPVEVAWDATGRLYVADMRDDPLGPEIGGRPLVVQNPTLD
jgi:hypothetical protein